MVIISEYVIILHAMRVISDLKPKFTTQKVRYNLNRFQNFHKF